MKDRKHDNCSGQLRLGVEEEAANLAVVLLQKDCICICCIPQYVMHSKDLQGKTVKSSQRSIDDRLFTMPTESLLLEHGLLRFNVELKKMIAVLAVKSNQMPKNHSGKIVWNIQVPK